MEDLNITKCVTKDNEDMLTKKVISELKKNSFTYKNFEEVIIKVKEFYKIMQLFKLVPAVTKLFAGSIIYD